MSPIILVDVSNIAYRTHFVSKGLSHEGQPTSVLYGFLRLVYNLRTKISPRMLFCWDSGIPTPNGVPIPYWRKSLLPEYKGDRTITEDHLIVRKQMPLLHLALTWLGYTSVGIPGLEADDLFGIIPSHFPNSEILFYSADRDLYQLLTPDNKRIRILQPGKVNGHFVYKTADDVVQEYGVPIQHWAAYLALGGDSSDHIKPAKGMGPKTAVKLLQAGVYPWLNWQLASTQLDIKKGLKYKDCWEQVQKSYQAAQLPTTWDDTRIARYLQGATPYVNPDQHWRTPEEKMEFLVAFRRFCGQFGLLEMLSVYRQFFQKV